MTLPTQSADTSPTRNITSDKVPSEEGREGPVREKLEETTIEEQRKRESLELNDADMKEVPGGTDGRGRIRKKRSFEDTDDAENEGVNKHTRKRSRDADEPRPAKKERADIETTENINGINGTTDAPQEDRPISEETGTGSDTQNATSEVADNPNNDGPHDTSKPSTPPPSTEAPSSPTKISSTSGFVNASSKSPFASLDDSKSPFGRSGTPSTSGGFGSSGFASFSKTSASPFGALSPSKASKETSSESPIKPPTEQKLSFTSAGAAPSGFGSLGGQTSGFGGVLGSQSPFKSAGAAPKLDSFASGKTPSEGLFSGGVKGDDDDNDGEEGGEESDPEAPHGVSTEPDKQDERFYEQEVETGEEGETVLFQCRAKLYWMQDGTWKERGVGTFKVNAKKVDDTDDTDDTVEKSLEEGTMSKEAANENGVNKTEENKPPAQVPKKKTAARFIFRTDGSHRMMLNSSITKEVELQDRNGGPPSSKASIFTGFVDGKPTPCLLQVKLPSLTQELAESVTLIKEQL